MVILSALQTQVHARLLQTITLLRLGINAEGLGVLDTLESTQAELETTYASLSPLDQVSTLLPWVAPGEIAALAALLKCQLNRGRDMEVAARALTNGRSHIATLRSDLESGRVARVSGGEVQIALRRLLVMEVCFFEIEFQLCLNSFKVDSALLTLHALFAHAAAAPAFLNVYSGLLHAWLGDFCVAANALEEANTQYQASLAASQHDPRVALYAQLGVVKVLLYQHEPQAALAELEQIFEERLRAFPHYETFVAEYALLRAQIETHLPNVTLSALNSVIALLEASLAKVSTRLLDAFMEAQIHSVLGSAYWLKRDNDTAESYLLGSLHSAQSSLLIDANNLALLSLNHDHQESGEEDQDSYTAQKAAIDAQIAAKRAKVQGSSYFRLVQWAGGNGEGPAGGPEVGKKRKR